MRENGPVPAAQPEALSVCSPSLSSATNAARGGQSTADLPRMPHRQAHVAAQWRAARAWLKLAYPRGVQAQLQARFPELAENVAHLRWVADQEGAHYECEPGAGPDAFQNALRAWEAAMLDALAALAHEASHA